MVVAVFAQFLKIDNLIAEPPGVGDILNPLHISADFESTKSVLVPHSESLSIDETFAIVEGFLQAHL